MEQSIHLDTDDSITTFKEYVILLWSWLWLILLVGGLAGGVTYYFSSRITPVYETSTRVLVSDPPILLSNNYNYYINSQTVLRTYVAMMTERSVLQGVIEDLGLEMLADELKGLITVSVVSETQLIQVSVRDTDALRAAFIADSVARVFAERINQLQAVRYEASRVSLSTQIESMDQQIQEVSSAIEREPNQEKKVQLEDRLTQYRQIYSTLVSSYEQVRLAEAQTSVYVEISESARIPVSPISPNTFSSTLMAVFLGMVLMAGCLLLIAYLDDTLKNPDDIRRKFNLPILGMIAAHTVGDEKVICLAQPRSPVSEAFRSLRTNVMYAAYDSPLHRVLVTSATPQEGKTTISCNLAVVMAQGERTVVLMDADMRRPQVHQRLGMNNHKGMSDIFLYDSNMEDIPAGIVQTGLVDRLGVITSGKVPPNPSELLSSRKMAAFLEQLSKFADLVLIDTPPLLTVTDAAALAPMMDGVIIVARPGVTKMRDFRQMLEQLQTVGAHTLGVVLNEVNPSNRKYGYYYNRYYTKYSGYYDSHDKKKKRKRSRAPK